MRVFYLDTEGCVCDLDVTDDKSLIPVMVDDEAFGYPFNGWSDDKICCYKVTVEKGIVTMISPNFHPKFIKQIDFMASRLNKKIVLYKSGV